LKMRTVELDLPWPPSVNHYKKMAGVVQTHAGKLYQRRVDTDETKIFYQEVWLKICEAKATQGVKSFDSKTISLCVRVDLYPPDKRRRDIDNSLKVLLDSLVRGGLIIDDYLIDMLIVTRKEVFKGGKSVVCIAEMT